MIRATRSRNLGLNLPWFPIDVPLNQCFVWISGPAHGGKGPGFFHLWPYTVAASGRGRCGARCWRFWRFGENPFASDRYTVTYPLASAGSLGTDTGHLYFSWDIIYIFETNEHTYLFQVYNIQLFFAASNAAYKAGQNLGPPQKKSKWCQAHRGTVFPGVVGSSLNGTYSGTWKTHPSGVFQSFLWKIWKGVQYKPLWIAAEILMLSNFCWSIPATCHNTTRSLGGFTGTEVQLWRPS